MGREDPSEGGTDLRQTGAVIEFGTSKITALMGDAASGDHLEVFGYGMVPYAGFRKGQWLEPEKLKDSLLKAVSDRKSVV